MWLSAIQYEHKESEMIFLVGFGVLVSLLITDGLIYYKNSN
jgi:hypothetical protein